MGFIANAAAGILGIGGGQGSDFKATPGATQQQAQSAYNNTENGLGMQNQFAQAVAGQNGLGNQSNVFAQQQQLANQLGQQAMGQGPNPAQAQLAQNTGNLVQQQGALMGSQRGASANAGLLARQAGMQGSNIQQQAVGQAATLQAQQQIAAQQQLAAQQQAMQQVAANQVGTQQGAINSFNQGAQGQQQNILGAIGNQNSTNAGVAANNANNSAKGIGGVLGGIGSAIAGPIGGAVSGALGSVFGGGSVGSSGAGAPGQVAMAPMMANGGMVDGPCSRVGKHFHAMKSGGKVPGKAKVAGDSRQNDTVTAKLSPGEIVVPRSHAQDPEKAAAFARAVAMKNQGKK